MDEIEIKLEVDSGSRAGVARAFAGRPAQRTRLRATYWDTPDGRLAARGIALRVRQEGRRWVQTAKAMGDSVLHRLEQNVALPGRWPSGGPPADPARHAGTPVGDLLEAALDGAPSLEARYKTDVLRRAIRVESEGCAVEVAFDEGEVRAGGERSAVCEVEIEHLSGTTALLYDIARSGIAAHGLRVGTLSKSARGERLRRGVIHLAPVKATPPRLTGAMNLDAMRRLTVAACLAQALPNAEEVALGSTDPHHVHQLRVALRRLRTALREFGPSDAIDPAWESQLARAFRELGVLRDSEIMKTVIGPRLLDAGAPAVPELAPAVPARAAASVVRDPALQRSLVDLIEYASAPADPEAPVAKKALRKILQRLHRKLARQARAFETLSREDQHAVRKLLKRLRYVVEFAGTLFEARKVGKYLKQLEPAQDALGRHNDEAVALAALRRAADAGDAHAWFAVGWLTARQSTGTADCARALERIAKAPRFFD